MADKILNKNFDDLPTKEYIDNSLGAVKTNLESLIMNKSDKLAIVNGEYEAPFTFDGSRIMGWMSHTYVDEIPSTRLIELQFTPSINPTIFWLDTNTTRLEYTSTGSGVTYSIPLGINPDCEVYRNSNGMIVVSIAFPSNISATNFDLYVNMYYGY